MGKGSLESACETFLLGRLGTELADIYHGSLQAPLPPALQTLIDRLDGSCRESEHDPDEPC